MLSEKNLYPYQRTAINHVIAHEACALFLDLGLGKTVSTLTALNILKNEYFEVNRILVIAPKRVAEEVWSDEVNNWSHLNHLTVSKVLGTAKQRKQALAHKADLYITNRENVVWLVAQYGTKWPFDTVVIDELSSFKNSQTARFKALRRVRPLIKKMVGLTATPAPNSLLDLWPQMYLLDQGERLGKTLGGFRDKYFTPNKRNGHVIYNYKEKNDLDQTLFGTDGYETEIYDKISDICISMKSRDYLDLPETIYREIKVPMPPALEAQYLEFEKTQILSLLDSEITAVNATALSGKLLQFANGAVYDENKIPHEVHREKLAALDEIIDTATSPVLIFYWFKHDCERLTRYLARYRPVNIKEAGSIQKWNKGKIKVLLAQPGSAGHGLNMQFGGYNIIWFGQTWSLELYQQANGRLPRPGQTHNVIIHNLLLQGSMDYDVWLARINKEAGQEALLAAVKARAEKYLPVAV